MYHNPERIREGGGDRKEKGINPRHTHTLIKRHRKQPSHDIQARSAATQSLRQSQGSFSGGGLGVRQAGSSKEKV